MGGGAVGGRKSGGGSGRPGSGGRSGRAGVPADPVLTVRAPRGPVTAVALVLHGGRAHSFDPVRGRHLSPSRMIPFVQVLHRRGGPHGLAVMALRNRVRGWNGPEMSALQDARWALERIRQQHPGVPVYLVGHSMGGLTAVCAADDPQVRAVAALAPWLESNTPVAPVADRHLLIVHGDADRWTSPRQSRRFAERALPLAASVRYVSVRSAGHFMFRKVGRWHGLTASFILGRFAADTGARVDPAHLRLAETVLAADEPLAIRV
ncbi:alpha/beta hydrolase [Arthrobacter sp. TMN-37]